MTNTKYHKISTFAFSGNAFSFWFDVVVVILSFLALVIGPMDFFYKDFHIFFFLTVAIIGLLPVFVSAVKAVINRKLTIDLLASIALIFALISREYHSAVFISLMLASARFFAYFTDQRARHAIASLLKLRPTKVLIRVGDVVLEKHIDDIRVDDMVIVETGERVAIDGVVAEGNASIDQSSLTGESVPIFKKVGDEVFSSTLNVSGSLVVKTTKVGDDTTFAKILKLIEESQKGKAPISSITEKFTNIYILITLVGSLSIYFFTHSLPMVLSVLLVTCADDLAIAIPLAFTAAIGTAAKRGIIIKGASFIEGLPKIKTMFFDKTGTLTKGKPQVKEIYIFKKFSENKFLSILGGLNIESTHPLARAVYNLVKGKKIKLAKISEVNEKPGNGISGTVDGKKVFAGNVRFLQNEKVVFDQRALKIIEAEKSLGRMIVALGMGRSLIGVVSFADTIRPQVVSVMANLKKLGVEKLIMLTGDNEIVAGEIAKEAGLTDYHANLLPADKVNFVKKSINKKYKVAMFGDGINDAASLALADISFAMGAIGSDASIEAADIALMKDDLSEVANVIHLSRNTMKIIDQNIFLWGLTNVVGLILVFTGVLGPSGAAAFNFLTDFVPPANSLRLSMFRYLNLPKKK